MDDSLQRLKTDHLDLLQIHWPDRYLPLFGSGVYDGKNEREGDVSFEEQLKGLEKVIKAGKVSETCFSLCRRAGQGRAGQGKAGQGRAGQGKAGQGRPAPLQA